MLVTLFMFKKMEPTTRILGGGGGMGKKWDKIGESGAREFFWGAWRWFFGRLGRSFTRGTQLR